jgi:predicted nucleotidyltransferase
MPVRLLSSSVLKWPNRDQVDKAVRAWAGTESTRHPELCRLAYFGCYARGDWGVGSDLDLIAVVKESTEPFHRRPLNWDLSALLVAADLLVYTLAEWRDLTAGASRLARTLAREAIWVFPRGEAAPGHSQGVPLQHALDNRGNGP